MFGEDIDRDGAPRTLEEAALDALPDAVVLYRQERIVYLNRAACVLLHIAHRDELLGRSPLVLVDPADASVVRARIERLQSGVPVETRDTRFRRTDGSTLILEVASIPVILADGPAVLCVGRDTGGRREAAERRRQADRAVAVGSLVAGVAHEINNPLTFVFANLGYAVRELRAAASGAPLDPARLEEVIEALCEAREGAERIGTVVRDLRTYSRVDEVLSDRVDVRRVLETSVNLAASEIRVRARLVTELGPVPVVAGSDGRLGQVFLNLLVNASQAIAVGAPNDNEIRVSCYEDIDGQAVVEVSDTGTGMEPEVRTRIFDPFFTTKPNGMGTGLGLAICQRILSEMGGDIDVDTSPGLGTTFRVRLPPAGVEA